MNSTTKLSLSILSGLLLAASWPVVGFSALLFIGFVPLLLIERNIRESNLRSPKKNVFGYSYLTFLIWNGLTTWWVYNASAGGGIIAITANSLFMATLMVVYYVLVKHIKKNWANFLLIPVWISFEYLHQHWDLTWPWLTLGNGFASTLSFVQWYEFTGVFGGSVWILVVNIMLVQGIIYVKGQRTGNEGRLFNKHILIAISIILVPILGSIVLRFARTSYIKGGGFSVVVVQPNIDPYKEKFSGNADEQLRKMLALGESKVDSTTEYLVYPETAISQTIWENDMQGYPHILMLKEFCKKYPKLKIVIGAVTAYQYKPDEPMTATARKFKGSTTEFYEDYNTALQVSNTEPIQKYHKSRFVPGVEMMPFPALLKPLEALALDMGGTTGSLCAQPERSLLYNHDSSIAVAPVICYESIFGSFVGDYVRKGANIIYIITNDGWWGDTPGYKQHLVYGALRAIENRMWIARSANTGTSCFISPLGEIIQPTEWWKEDVIKMNLYTNNKPTFYACYGDWIAVVMICVFLLSLALAVFAKSK